MISAWAIENIFEKQLDFSFSTVDNTNHSKGSRTGRLLLLYPPPDFE